MTSLNNPGDSAKAIAVNITKIIQFVTIDI
jgi:hypothetical protein